ncbi:MAG: LexA family protein [Caulobacteraceae bacterium]
MKAGLTKAQRAVLDAIRELTVDGLAPTYDELAAHLGITSRGHVSRHLVILRDKGRITFERRARSIRIIEDGQPAELETASAERLRGVIEEAAEALSAQVGRKAAADILSLVLANQRARAKREAQPREPGRPHRFKRKSG